MNFTCISEAVTEQQLSVILHDFITLELPRRQRLFDYYTGDIDVNKGRVVPGRPNNNLTANFARYITDVQTGYFMGVPPTYDFDSRVSKEAMLEVIANSDLNHSLFAAAKDMSICGEGYIMTYMHKTGVGTCRLSPLETFAICDSTVTQSVLAIVRIHKIQDEKYTGQLHTPGIIRNFTYDGKRAALDLPRKQLSAKIPISRMCNNMDCTGDFESVLSLLNAYNLLLSGAMDDMQSVANAFLAIYGMQGTRQEDIDRANSSRILSLCEGGKAEFVVKNLNSDAISLLKKSLIDDMLMITMTPNLNDDAFGNASSGVALEYKLWGIEQSRSAKEGGFAPGLYHTLGLLWEAMKFFGSTSCGFCKARFYKNLPRDTSQLCDDIKKLDGVVSRKTLLSLLPFIEDSSQELQQLEEEAQ